MIKDYWMLKANWIQTVMLQMWHAAVGCVIENVVKLCTTVTAHDLDPPPPGGDVHPSWVITLHCDYVNTWKKLGEMLSIKGSKFLFHIQVVTAGGREGLMSRGEMVYRVHTNPGSTPNCTGGPWYMATAADTWWIAWSVRRVCCTSASQW